MTRNTSYNLPAQTKPSQQEELGRLFNLFCMELVVLLSILT